MKKVLPMVIGYDLHTAVSYFSYYTNPFPLLELLNYYTILAMRNDRFAYYVIQRNATTNDRSKED